MYNEAIVTSPVALFLGAGASKPFGKKLMGEFITHLQSSALGQTPLFQAIVTTETGADLEHLFEELDEWSRKEKYRGDMSLTGMNLHRLVTRPGQPSQPSHAGVTGAATANVAREASRILNDLREAVFNEYCNIEDKWTEPLVRLFEPLFSSIFQHVNPSDVAVPVFTTNYDSVIETFCGEKAGDYILCDGFLPQSNAAYVWREQVIHNLDPKGDSRKHIVLFKLHGSTSWYERGTDFVKSSVPLYTAGSRHGFKNLLIYPAKRKVALNNPYFTAYDYFQRTLERCKLCIVIGYSFRDYDALSRLRSAAAYNPKLKLLVIDPEARKLCATLQLNGINAEPVVACFGSEIGKNATVSAAQSSATDYQQRIREALANLDSLESLDSSDSLDVLSFPDQLDSTV